MIGPLIARTVRDARLLFAATLVLMFFFPWLFIWGTSKISLPAFSDFLTRALPQEWQQAWGVPFSEVATPAGRVALIWVHPLIMLGGLTWAVARGSDCVSGEIGRGTMEMLLAQPVRRISVYATHAAVTIIGSGILAFAAWCGLAIGLLTTQMHHEVAASRFIPPAINFFAFMVCTGGMSALASSWDSQRWRTVGIMAAVYVGSVALSIAGQMSQSWRWLRYLSFLNVYRPQTMVARAEAAWLLVAHKENGAAQLGLGGCQLVLFGLGLAAYIAGAIIFTRREIPAPI
jgi:ABC-2 type transport system permease protein